MPSVTWRSEVSSSEERRVGKECRSRWSPYHYKKKRGTTKNLCVDGVCKMQDQANKRGQQVQNEVCLHRHPSQGIAGRFFFSSRRRHTRSLCDWSSDVCSSDLNAITSRPRAPKMLLAQHVFAL